MSKTIQSLREEHKQAVDEAAALLNADGELSPEQVEKVEALTAKAEKLTAEIGLRNRQIKQAELTATPSEPAPKPIPGVQQLSGGVHSELKLTGCQPKHFASEEAAYISGMWLSGYLLGNRKAKEWCLAHSDYYDSDLHTLAQSEADDMKGGLFVPQQIESAIDKIRMQYGVFRNRVRVIPMGTDNALVPRPLTGTTWYAVGETPASITESDATAASFELTVKNWAGFTRFSRDLDEDATISIADSLVREFAYQKLYTEDNTGFNGDGGSTHNGIQGVFWKLQQAAHTASVYTTISGNTTWGTLDMEDWILMAGKLPQYPGIQPAWYMTSQAFYSGWARLAYATGGTTKDDVAGGTAQQILGFPVVFTDVLNKTLASQAGAYGCLFGDLRMAATMGVRRGMQVQRLVELYAQSRQIGLIVSDRWGLTAHDLGDTTTVGPVVIMKFNS